MKRAREVAVLENFVPEGVVRTIDSEIRHCLDWQLTTPPTDGAGVTSWSIDICSDYVMQSLDLYPLAELLVRCAEPQLIKRGMLGPGYKIEQITADGRSDGQHGLTSRARKDQDKLSLVYFVNASWKSGWGGELRLFSSAAPIGKLVDEESQIVPDRRVEFAPGRLAAFAADTVYAMTAPTNRSRELRMAICFVIANPKSTKKRSP